jgi:hypothetical protein
MSYSFQNLRSMSDEDLIKAHDVVATHTQFGVNYFLDELRRRDASKEAKEIHVLTVKLESLTKWIFALTVVTTTASVVSMIKSFS